MLSINRCPSLTLKLATAKSWVSSYQVEAHVALCDAILDMNAHRKSAQAHANMISTTQGSGKGNFRMVDKLAELEFTLPFNLRSADANKCGLLQDSCNG